MRESISMTTVFQIFVLFVLLFTAIMCLTINNANAFGVKDEIVNIIEMAEGNYLQGDSLDPEIVEAFKTSKYRTTGRCEDGYQGYDKEGNSVSQNNRATVCIKEVNVKDGINNYLKSKGLVVAEDDFNNGVYYQVMVFFQLDLPVVNQVFNLTSKGETRIIYKDGV